MLLITPDGSVLSPFIKTNIKPHIERGKMHQISGIIVHQTGGSNTQSTLDSYNKPSADGAHFLIDKDGNIYQTASIFKKTHHVGKLRPRCVAEFRCSPPKWNPKATHWDEMNKKPPDRYPSNEDSIGIELVGDALPRAAPDSKKVYESVTFEQGHALQWLIAELSMTLGIASTEIFRHPVVSYKNATEASTAQW